MVRYVPGQSGNPAGRPKGIVDRRRAFDEMIGKNKPAVFNKALQMALNGNERMIEMFMDRILPAKPKDDVLPDGAGDFKGSLSEQAAEAVSLMAEKLVTPAEAIRILGCIESEAGIKKVDDLEDRVFKIEELNKQKNV